MNNLQYDLYDKREYFAALTKAFDASGRGNRILLMSMGFSPDQAPVAKLMKSLLGAAERGAHITFSVDARAFLEGGKYAMPGPLWYTSQLSTDMPGVFGAKYRFIKQLDALPTARARVINLPSRRFSISIAGRSHIKTAIIDDLVFVGGCNLDRVADTDLMISWRDQHSVEALYELMQRGIAAGNMRQGLDGVDRTIDLDNQTTLYIDAGVPRQSIIFDHALKAIDDAHKWLTLTCQFFPNSITAQHLLHARTRGVKTDIIYSHPRTHGLVGAAEQYLNQIIERAKLPHEMFAHQLPAAAPKLHAKLLATDKGVMIGSHNYVNFGVGLGTAEIALQSSDARLAESARQKILDQLG